MCSLIPRLTQRLLKLNEMIEFNAEAEARNPGLRRAPNNFAMVDGDTKFIAIMYLHEV